MLRRRSRNMKQKKTWFKKEDSKTGITTYFASFF